MILRVLALQVWTLAFVGFFGSELLGSYPALRIAAQVLFVGPLVVWAALRLRGPRDGLDWAVTATLGALLIVSLFSVDVQGSLESVGLALAYALTFFLMRSVGSVPRLRTAVAVAVSYALVFWLAMIWIWWIQEKVAWVTVFGSVPNLESNQVFIWGTANVFPVLSMLAVPFLRWQPAGTGRRVLVVVWVVASAVAIPLSAGRAGWLGIIVAVVAYDWLSGWSWLRTTAGWLRRRRLLVPALGAGGLIGLAGVAFVVLHLGQVVDSALDGRGEIWRQALALFGSDPLTGSGPSTYSWFRLTTVPDYTFPLQVRLAHSVPLLTLADGGLVLAVAFAGLLVVFARTARRFTADPERRTALAVLVGFAAASCFDDFSSLPAVMAIVVSLAAWVVAPGAKRVQSLNSSESRLDFARAFGLPAAMLLIALIAILPVVGVDRARVAAASAREAAIAGDWTTAAARFSAATESYGTDASYWLGLGLARAELADVDGAGNAYERARTLNPGDARAWAGVAALTPDGEAKLELLQGAAKRWVWDGAYAFRLGSALSGAREDEAIHAYAIGVILDPQLMIEFRTTAPEVVAEGGKVFDEVERIVDDVAPRAGRSPDAVRWDLDVLGGGSDPNLGPAWQAVKLASTGDTAGAQAAAAEALRQSPYDRTTLLAVQAVARMSCDRDRYDAISSIIGPLDTSASDRLRIVRDNTYREDALSSYDPPQASSLTEPRQAWPWWLVGDRPECPDWADAP
jgi:O-antigen ligase/tetratricopeptide (TPR) repeat protein